MDQKEMFDQLKKNPTALKAILQSQDGRKLMQMLSAGNQQATLHQAAQQASVGNTQQISQMIQNLMASPEGAALVQRLEQQFKP